MEIQWSIVATIAAPIIALFVGAVLNRVIENRPRLVMYLGYVSAHRIDQGVSTPIDIYTHSVVLKNAGRSPAHNVRLTHAFLPNFNIHPSIQYTTEHLPGGDVDIVIPVLVPQQEMTIAYLYYPPATWDTINRAVKSDEGFAKVLRVLPTVRYPAWVNAVAGGLMLLGTVALSYAFVVLVVRFW